MSEGSERSELGAPARVAAVFTEMAAKALASGLYIVATPIGNLGDITLRALTVLARADIIYCEDTRHSRTLIAHYGLTTKLDAYHEHNGERARPRILQRLEAGERVALISDAGTPLISDPGYKLVREVSVAGHAVFALPGPCAAVAALTLAGLPTDCFMFAGFLPPKSGQRQNRLAELRTCPATLIFYEAPTRVAQTLSDMAHVLGPRACAIAREITKLHEDVQRGTLPELARTFDDQTVRGEIAIVVAPPGPLEITDEQIREALTEALRTSSTRDAVRAVTTGLGAARTRVYDLAMMMRNSIPGGDL
jgi:16S rRNA (cytidine1402-2'-O)-methyltransferase